MKVEKKIYIVDNKQYTFATEVFDNLYRKKRGDELDKVFEAAFSKRMTDLGSKMGRAVIRQMRFGHREPKNLEEIKNLSIVLECKVEDLLIEYVQERETLNIMNKAKMNIIQIRNIEKVYGEIYDFVYEHEGEFHMEDLEIKYRKIVGKLHKSRPFLTRESYDLLEKAIEEICFPLIQYSIYDEMYIDTGEWKGDTFEITNLSLMIVKHFKILEPYRNKVDKLGRDIFVLTNY